MTIKTSRNLAIKYVSSIFVALAISACEPVDPENPEGQIPQPEDQAPQPEEQAPAPEPEAPAPQPEAPAPQPEAPAPQPEAPAPQPEVPEPEPEPEPEEEEPFQALISEGNYSVVSVVTGKPIDVFAWSVELDANVIQYAWTGGNNQRWYFAHLGDNEYRIESIHSGLALGVNPDTNNVNQQYVSAGDNVIWLAQETEAGKLRFTNKATQKDLSVFNGVSLDGMNIEVADYNTQDKFHWRLTDDGSNGSANGQLSWRWTSSGVPGDAYDRITATMNAAVARYNKGANMPPRTLTVEFNYGVATADAHSGGHIRFGPDANYQNERTALHEISHTYGVGQTQGWYNNIVDYRFVGNYCDNLIKFYDGESASISTGGNHFWPYGLNYNSEFSEANARRHVQIVWAMVLDGSF